MCNHLEAFGDIPIDKITTAYLQDYIRYLQLQGLKCGTVRLYFQKLAMLFLDAYSLYKENKLPELLTAIRRGTITDAQLTVIEPMKRFIGGNLAQNKYAARSAYEDLLGTLDANLETYTTYANSEAYKLNHFTHYANAADDPCYFFG